MVLFGKNVVWQSRMHRLIQVWIRLGWFLETAQIDRMKSQNATKSLSIIPQKLWFLV